MTRCDPHKLPFNSARSGRILRVLLLTFGLLAAAGGGYYGYVMFVDRNFHEVVPDKLYRSARPTDEKLREWTKAHGIRTVISIGGGAEREEYTPVIDAAEELDLTFHGTRWSTSTMPTRKKMLQFIEWIEESPKPILIHCRRGADRTGLACVIGAMALGGWTYEEARPQLSLRYWHVNNDPRHVDGPLLMYEDYREKEGADTGGWPEFRKWVVEHYHPTFEE